MYTLLDNNKDKLCLRPESTAGVMRAFVHSPDILQQSLPQRLYYHGPMFRYERPQKGRYRQFHQVGVELLGPQQTSADVSMIEMANHFLQNLNITKGVSVRGNFPTSAFSWLTFLWQLELNTLGDSESRLNYKRALTEFLSTRYNDLSKLSKERCVAQGY